VAYVNNKFCWHSIVTGDVEKAKSFYSDAIGWGITTMEMGDETATMVTAAGIPRAHIMQPPMEGVPNHISSYLRVEDVDAGVEAAVANGGKVVAPPTDIPPGRFSAVASPSSAVFLLFHEANEETAQNPRPGDGAIHWVELHSTDIDADIEWLTNAFGLTAGAMDMPNGGSYYMLGDEETSVGGAMQTMNPGAPSHWLVWISVADVDACLGRVKSQGGQIFNDPMDMPGVGRMAVVADNQGAAFGVITPEQN
jgi:predicted enzyme related to lactoylglutathione lyase